MIFDPGTPSIIASSVNSKLVSLSTRVWLPSKNSTSAIPSDAVRSVSPWRRASPPRPISTAPLACRISTCPRRTCKVANCFAVAELPTKTSTTPTRSRAHMKTALADRSSLRLAASVTQNPSSPDEL